MRPTTSTVVSSCARGTVRYDDVAATDTGTLLFTGGILQAGASGTLANLSAFFDVSGATIDTQAFDVTLNAVIANSGAPTGTFTKLGSGTLTLANSGNSYSTATLVSDGTLAGGAANVFGNNSAVTVAGAAVLDLGGFDQAIGSLSGAGTVTNSGAADAALTAGGDNTSTIFSGVIEDGPTNATSLTKIGAGTLTLTGDSTYLGGTTISAGTLQLGSGGASGSIVGDIVNNGALVVNRSNTSDHDRRHFRKRRADQDRRRHAGPRRVQRLFRCHQHPARRRPCHRRFRAV